MPFPLPYILLGPEHVDVCFLRSVLRTPDAQGGFNNSPEFSGIFLARKQVTRSGQAIYILHCLSSFRSLHIAPTASLILCIMMCSVAKSASCSFWFVKSLTWVNTLWAIPSISCSLGLFFSTGSTSPRAHSGNIIFASQWSFTLSACRCHADFFLSR